ncbi:MAG: PAS domain S-box protein [Kiritimatiellaeota bacterium]|nr:PAS domain S-box protein [Kiritimatiellota bacterium]
MTERTMSEVERDRLIPAIEQSGEAIFLTDTQGVIQYVNRAFEQITGFSREAAQGQRPSLLSSGRHEAKFFHQMWDTIRRGNVWNGRVINKRKDGRVFHAELTIAPVRDPQGKLVNFVAVSRDVTHELELEEQLHQSQKMESIGRLAGGVAHDFNNLLTSIMGFAHMIYNSLPEGSPQLEQAKEIIFASERSAQLTRQLLTFSRKEVRRVQPLNLNSIMREMEQLLRRTLGEHIVMRVDLDPRLGTCDGDLMQMQRVLLNLAVNARDAMPRGGRLEIRTHGVKLDEAFCATRVGLQPGAYAQLSVRDEGCGIPEDARSHIFEPFFTTKEKDHGTGLGLSMIYAIVQQAHGYIEFESEVKRGTEFKLYFPQSAAVNASITPPTAKSAGGGAETILVVEDDELVRSTALNLLTSLGYRVLTAGDANEAEDLCRRHKGTLHMILSDVIMPRVSGTEMVRKLHTVRRDFKVLYMSGFTEETIIQHGVTYQHLNFLSKPFTRETLGLKVREMLDGKE